MCSLVRLFWVKLAVLLFFGLSFFLSNEQFGKLDKNAGLAVKDLRGIEYHQVLVTCDDITRIYDIIGIVD